MMHNTLLEKLSVDFNRPKTMANRLTLNEDRRLCRHKLKAHATQVCGAFIKNDVPCEQEEHCPDQIFECVFQMPGRPTDTVTQLLCVHDSRLHVGEGWGRLESPTARHCTAMC